MSKEQKDDIGTGIQCPSIGETPKTAYWNVVFCQQSQTIHLFQTRYEKHVSISLSQLNAAKSVLVNATPDSGVNWF